MASPRAYFSLATLSNGGRDQLFAIGGLVDGGSTVLNTVEEWVEESSTWKEAESLTTARQRFGVLPLAKHLICPA